MTTALFGRKLKVTIQDKRQKMYVWKNATDKATAEKNAANRAAGKKDVPPDPAKVEINYDKNIGGYTYDGSQFKIVFNVERVASAETPDMATIKIWNPKHNPVLDDPLTAHIIIEGGYNNLAGILYEGDLTLAQWGKNGSDMIYTAQCGDGDRLNRLEQYKSHTANTPVGNIVEEMITAFTTAGAEIMPDLIKKIKGIFSGEKIETKSISKEPSMKKLNKLLNTAGYQAVLVDNVLDVRKFYAASDAEAIVLNTESGLIGVPNKKRVKKTVKKVEKIYDAVDFECLLMPGLYPGRQINIDSNYCKGFFVIESVSYSGDSFGNDWTARGEAIQINT